jgi:hypothetical protein
MKAALAALALFGASAAMASTTDPMRDTVRVEIFDSGTSLVVDFAGTLNLTQLSNVSGFGAGSSISAPALQLIAIESGQTLAAFRGGAFSLGRWGEATGSSLNSGNVLSETGDAFGIYPVGSTGESFLLVSQSFDASSPTMISGQVAFGDASIESIGLIEGSYTSHWEDGALELVIGNPTPVPLPASLPLAVMGIGLLGVMRRRKG